MYLERNEHRMRIYDKLLPRLNTPCNFRLLVIPCCIIVRIKMKKKKQKFHQFRPKTDYVILFNIENPHGTEMEMETNDGIFE